MSLKRRSGSMETFSMASMTDVIFLLLIFFMITSTLVVPNVIKVALPSSERQPAASTETARLTITPDLRYYIAYGSGVETESSFGQIPDRLGALAVQHPDLYLAIYADETVPYREVVKVITIAARMDIKLMLATKVVEDEAAAPSSH